MAARPRPLRRDVAEVTYRRRFPSDSESMTGVPDDLRWAIDVLRAAAPSRLVDEGHYANRALTYLDRLASRYRGRHDYASPEDRRKAYDAVERALREMTTCWVRGQVPTEEHLDAANTGLAVLAVLAEVPLEHTPPGRSRGL